MTHTPIIQTAAKSKAKIIYRQLTEINSCYYGLSVMRTLTRGPNSVRHKGSWLYSEKITPLLNSVVTNKQRLLQSTLALWASLYYRHPANTDSCWMPGENFRRLTETNSRLFTNSRDYGHQSTSCGNILVELSQNIIYFFLFLCSSLSPWLKSGHSDFCLTSCLYETTVLTCKKQSGCT